MTQRLLPQTLVLDVRTGAFLAACALSHNAHAMAAPPPPPMNQVVLSPTNYAPGNVILGRLECPLGCTLEDLSFTDSSGTVLKGQFVDVSATLGTDLFAWLPDTDLELGWYSVNLAGSSDGTGFTIGADSPLALFDVAVSELRNTTGEGFTCVEKEGTLADIHFYESVLVQARINAQVAGASVSQYIYDLIVNDEPTEPFSDPRINRVVEGTPSEICYELFARPIIGGDDFLLASDCLPTDASALGVQPETSSNQDYVLARCIVPPVGYDAEWCAVFSAAFEERSCSTFVYKESCFAARRACPQGDDPPPGTEEEEQMMGVGGSGSGGVTGDGDGDGDGDIMGDGDARGDGGLTGDGDSVGDGDARGDGGLTGDGDSVGGGDGGIAGDGNGGIAGAGDDAPTTQSKADDGSCSVGKVGSSRNSLSRFSWMFFALGGLFLRRRRFS